MSLIEGFDNEELAFKIYDNEGFDYFFRFYITPGKINDLGLRVAVMKYVAAAEKIEKILERNGVCG